MQLKTILRLLTIWQLCALSQNSHVQEARQRIRAEVRAAVGPPPSHHHHPHHYHHHHHHQQQGWHHQGQRVHRWPSGHGKRWSGRRKSLDRHHFSGWSAWSACDGDCVKRRERFCRVKRKCGYTKHLEERKCGGCHPTPVWHPVVTSPAHQDSGPQTIHHTTSNSPSIIINAAQNGPYLVPTQPSSPPPTEPPTVPPTALPTSSSPTWPPTSSPTWPPTWSSSPQPSLPPPPHSGHRHIRLPVLQEIERHPPRFVDTPPASHELGEWGELPSVNDDDNVFHGHHVIDTDDIDNENNGDDDFYVINTRPRYKKKRKPIMIEVDDYDDLVLEAEEEDEVDNQLLASTLDAKRFAGPVRSIRTGSERGRGGKKNEQGRQQERGAQRQRQGRDQSQLQRQGKNRKQQGQDQSQQQGQGQSQQQVRNQSQQQVRDQSQQRQGRSHQLQPQVTQRSLAPHVDDGIEGDIFQYEDFDFDQEPPPRSFGAHDEYGDSYEDDYVENRNGSLLHHLPSKEKATPDALIPKHRRIYSKWSRWTKCSPKCTTRRYKKCRVREQCGREVLREIAYCYTEGSFCQQWLQAQVQKTPPYELRPVTASRRRDITGDGPQSNAIVSDYIMHGKGYRGPEYTPQKLKCGIAPIRSNRRNMYNMLKIIGGKAARKGEWPWQVAIFNRFKEAFCGGTLIAPQWVLTAAHCVRKVLYVRLGEHNLDYEDGTEQQLRVLRSYKHPNFDKKTVDSDVALLRLPKPVNTTTWIGFSCLPRPYQPLPKNMDCTVIGWGKRRNRDVAGTSVLHQAEVPIIPMDNCRSVYHDYTITKNMFCAGHKRGRIDTCAGDSGGPLLCRDTTKPNHPWTIFGITSFGDGCAKRNKFGIYAKVPNYVDWVWSVVNCNGNCKLHQRGYSN